MRRPRGPALLVVAIGLAAGGVGAWLLWGPSLVPPDDRTQAVRAAAESAVRTLYLDALPPATYRGGPLPSAAAEAMRERVSADIEHDFTPPLQARYLPMGLAAIDQVATGMWDSVGDLEIDWGRATIAGDEAAIAFRERIRLIRHANAAGASPSGPFRVEGSWDWRVTLLRDGGRWRVASLDARCNGACP